MIVIEQQIAQFFLHQTTGAIRCPIRTYAHDDQIVSEMTSAITFFLKFTKLKKYIFFYLVGMKEKHTNKCFRSARLLITYVLCIEHYLSLTMLLNSLFWIFLKFFSQTYAIFIYVLTVNKFRRPKIKALWMITNF